MLFGAFQHSICGLLFYSIMASASFFLCASEQPSNFIIADEHFWQKFKDGESSVKLIEEYIQTGQHVIMQDAKGCTFLHYAARFGNIALAEKLLMSKVDPNCFNRLGETPLHEALMGESEELVLLLVRFGAQVHYASAQKISLPDEKNSARKCESPWQRAVRCQKTQFYKCLIAYGHCVNFTNHEEVAVFKEAFQSVQELLWYALKSHNTRGIEYALSLGAHVDGYDEQLEMSPLEYAILHDHADSALVLLRHGAHVHQIDFYVRDCIRQAYVHKAYKVMPLLIAYGAQLDSQNKEETDFICKAIPSELEQAVIYDRRDRLLEIISRLRTRRRSLSQLLVPEPLELLQLPHQHNNSTVINSTNERRALTFAVGRMNKYLVMKVLDFIPHCNPAEAVAVFNTICKRGDASLNIMGWHQQIEILLNTRIILFKIELQRLIKDDENYLLTLPEEVLCLILDYALGSVVHSSTYSPLYEAIQLHDSDLVKWLLQKDFSAIDGLPLHSERYKLIVSEQLPSVIGPTKLVAAERDILLHQAAACSVNSTAIIRLLISYGASVNHQDLSTGQTALHKACLGFATDVVQFLLEHGAQITCDKNGSTPQDLANQIGAHYCAIVIERWKSRCEEQEVEQVPASDKDIKKKHKKKDGCALI